MKSQELIIYRNLQHRELFDHVSTLLAVGPDDKPGTMPDSYACASQLIDMAVTYGFEGNLWHCFLAFCLANNENVYSTSCEIVGHIEGSLNELAAHDFNVIKELFDYDIQTLDGGCLVRTFRLPRGQWQQPRVQQENPGPDRGAGGGAGAV